MGEEEATLTIGELAEECGMTRYTLRYYERVGLIPLVERTEAGHRRYRPDHVDWLRLLERLRASDMPIQMMKAYTDLVVEGRDNLPERRRPLIAPSGGPSVPRPASSRDSPPPGSRRWGSTRRTSPRSGS